MRRVNSGASLETHPEYESTHSYLSSGTGSKSMQMPALDDDRDNPWYPSGNKPIKPEVLRLGTGGIRASIGARSSPKQFLSRCAARAIASLPGCES
jgi:hypothetical protein